MKYKIVYFLLIFLFSANTFSTPLQTVTRQLQASIDNNLEKLTVEEQHYLKEHPRIKVHSIPDAAPYMSINKDGKIVGHSIDYINLLASKMGLEVEVIQGYTWNQYIELIKEEKIDVMLNIKKTKLREDFLAFTTPYSSINNSLFVRKNSPFNTLNDFKGKTISVVEGYAQISLLEKLYPSITLLLVSDEIKAFKMVSFGKTDGTIHNLGIGSVIISKYNLTNLTPAFEIQDRNFYVDLHLATNKKNKHLRSILEKSKALVTEAEMTDIDNKWLEQKQIYDSYKLGYELFKYILIFITIIIAMVLYRYLIVRKINQKLIKQSKELKDTKDELRHLAFTDSMTNLYNRRYFIEASETILNLAIRNKTESFVIIIDIDDFKQVNDSYGHKIGDDVIILCANKFKELTRDSDLICRWGGEEFTILFPEINLDGALKIAEKIRLAIENIEIVLADNTEIKFTISIGLSQITSDDMDIHASIARADEALYNAKETGKNKVCTSLA